MPLTHGIQLIRSTAKAAFWQNFEQQPDVAQAITFVTDSDSDQETYPFLSAAPSPIEMEGSRTHKSVPEISYTIKNKKWESTVDISYEMIRFNRLGQIAALSAELGMKARNYRNKLIADLINDGDATAGPDSQFFFDTDHTDPGADYTTSQDNDISYNAAATTTLTDVEAVNAVRDALNQMAGFKDGQGDPVVPAPGTVFEVHTPADYLSGLKAAEMADQVTGPVGNTVKGQIRVIHNPWLDAAATDPSFYVFNPSGVRKPFVLQVADPVTFEDGMGSDMQLETKDSWIGSFGYYNAGYGDWRYACKVTIT